MAATVKLFMIEDGLLTSTIWCNSSVTQACPYLVVLPSETSLKRSRHPVRVQSWSLKCSQNTKSTFKQAISVLRSQHSVQSVQKSTNFPLGNCTGSEGFFSCTGTGFEDRDCACQHTCPQLVVGALAQKPSQLTKERIRLSSVRAGFRVPSSLHSHTYLGSMNLLEKWMCRVFKQLPASIASS